MDAKSIFTSMFAATAVCAAPPAHASVHDTLARFVGDWDMELRTHAESFGEGASEGVGTMECSWGLAEAWLDCQMDSEYESFGRYVLKIVLFQTGEEDVVGSFVTNSFGGGRMYHGRWSEASELVFVDAWIDPGMAWEHQRTTYTIPSDDEIAFMIEVSHDGETYLPHSSGSYRRR